MVDPITPALATTSSYASNVETTTSITSDPYNVWVAERQSQITADQQALARANRERADREERPLDDPADHIVPHERDAEHHHEHGAYGEIDAAPEQAEEEPLLSGESERIGTQNFDDDTPFGERVAIV